jgi:DNA-binding NarL/FixJ family response regulator
LVIWRSTTESRTLCPRRSFESIERYHEDCAINTVSTARAAAIRTLLTAAELDMLANAERLSNQERAVFVLLGQGMKPKAIGYELAVSVKTVDTHIARIRAKLCSTKPVPLADLLFLARMWVRAGQLSG